MPYRVTTMSMSSTSTNSPPMIITPSQIVTPPAMPSTCSTSPQIVTPNQLVTSPPFAFSVPTGPMGMGPVQAASRRCMSALGMSGMAAYGPHSTPDLSVIPLSASPASTPIMSVMPLSASPTNTSNALALTTDTNSTTMTTGLRRTSASLDHDSSIPDAPRKRKRHTRTTTGCRQCRVQRVKCPEGPVGPSGRKIICRRCWETDRPCFYPAKGHMQRGKNKEDLWERAEDVDDWTTAQDTQMHAHVQNAVQPYDWSATFATDTATTHLAPQVNTNVNVNNVNVSSAAPAASIEPLPQPHIQHGVPAGASIPQGTFEFVAPHKTRLESQPIPMPDLALESTRAPPPMRTHFLDAFFNPAIGAGILPTFTLASLTETAVDRSVVSYFESEGCNEIQSASKSKHNWIFNELFPRVFAALSSPPAQDDTSSAVRDWLLGCLLQLSYVHRGNIEGDQAKSWYWRSEAARWRQKASYAILRAKVRFGDHQWKTEEYLMGFFVRCMADMLDSGQLQIDHSTAFELPLDTASTFYPSLRDMIALYATIQFACTPLEQSINPRPMFELAPTGPEWVERFVGFSRKFIHLLGRVNGMVVQRSALIRAGTEKQAPGHLLRAQAERLVGELGESWDWNEMAQDIGKSDRIQRGNEVLREALRVMLLCEVLEVELSDPRIAVATDRAMELVADAEPVGMGGYQWAMTILAIYSVDQEVRSRIYHLLRLALAMSFGASYRGTEEILTLCWEVLDRNGRYDNGIAPWREALAAVGRNLFI